ncbi:MAG: DUF1330 domain-containing protein [Opitutaceae bacterium]|nr:DUF1330 domain-containing protein [Opitutaceae bacterium]
MSVYAIALIRIQDRAKYSAYERRFMEVFARFEGEVLAVDDAPRVLEGDWPGERTVLLRFPDEAALRRWYDSEAYREIVRDRMVAASADIAIVSGLGARDRDR